MALSEENKRRVDLLFDLGMMFNGQSYVGNKDHNKDFNMHHTEFMFWEDDKFNETYNQMKEELEKREAKL